MTTSNEPRRHRLERWRRARQLARVRAELQRRGLAVDQLSDEELEVAIASGREALTRARTRGGETTAAFVMLVRQRDKF